MGPVNTTLDQTAPVPRIGHCYSLAAVRVADRLWDIGGIVQMIEEWKAQA